MKKKIISLLMALCLVLLSIPAACAEGPEFSGGIGTSEDPYRISNAKDLTALAKAVNGGDKSCAAAYYQITDDIVLTGKWTPIGDSRETPFRGTIDGDGYTISGIQSSYSDFFFVKKAAFIGLVGYSDSAVLRNIMISESEFRADGELTVYAGALLGSGNDTIVENCHVMDSVSVYSTYNAGGLIGELSGGSASISECSSAAKVEAENSVGSAGGIAGIAMCSVRACDNSGMVTSIGNAGGISAYITGDIIGCRNTASIVSSSHNAAGIVASFSTSLGGDKTQSLQLTDCENTGSISGKGNAGGIAADFTGGNIRRCSNSGMVSAELAAGGIAANSHNSAFSETPGAVSVYDCENSGTVSGISVSGGIVGSIGNADAEITIGNCRNTGAVDGGKRVAGGILGEYDAFSGGNVGLLTFTDCHNTANIVGSSAAGIMGQLFTAGSCGTTVLNMTDCETRGSMVSLSDTPCFGGMVGELGSEGVTAVFSGCKASGVMDPGIFEATNYDSVPLYVRMGGLVGHYGNYTVKILDEELTDIDPVVRFTGCASDFNMITYEDGRVFQTDAVCGKLDFPIAQY